MSTPITMIGNLTAEPVARTIDSGDAVTTLRLASNSRYLDPRSGEWRDAGTLFMTVSCWRALAVNAASSLHKGDRVLVSGRLKQREYESDGVRRTVVEIDADALGPDLSRVVAHLQRATRVAGGAEGQPGDAGVPDPGDPDPGEPRGEGEGGLREPGAAVRGFPSGSAAGSLA